MSDETDLLTQLRDENPEVIWTGSEGLFRKAADEIERLGIENERLRLWLLDIADRHLGDQPAALNVPEIDWAKRHIRSVQRMARDALAGKDAIDGE